MKDPVDTLAELKALPEWKNLPDDVRFWMKKAYASGYYQKSDGISWIDQLRFKKHPAGVMHDYLYYSGEVSRKSADLLFKEALEGFGYPGFGKWWHRGLRIVGWFPWKVHRVRSWWRKQRAR